MPAVTATQVGDDDFLLDVRDDDEWHAGHVDGAHHVPMMELLARLDEVPQDRDVVVVCKVGGRSAQVTAYLNANGWERVRNLDGGMLAWVGAGRPMVSEDGHAARVL
ncbi:rhodanese-like domain-containing protein [Luedemannella flava]|uniref:Rhodanese-like domain-containing protein n=1 Tax=Luedemannella flava TaxID=349316 RepID=A0ABN2LF61_9ACTN